MYVTFRSSCLRPEMHLSFTKEIFSNPAELSGAGSDQFQAIKVYFATAVLLDRENSTSN